MSAYRIAMVLVALTAMGVPVAGQSPEQIKAEPIVKLKPGDTRVPGQCLSKEQLDMPSQMRTSGIWRCKISITSSF